jgi:hypothetical protein
MPEVGFINIGRGSLAYDTEFGVDDPGIKGPNLLGALGAFLGAKIAATIGKLGTEVWEKTGAKAIRNIKAGVFGKGTKKAAEAAEIVEKQALSREESSAVNAITGKAIAGEDVEKAAQNARGNSAGSGELSASESGSKEVQATGKGASEQAVKTGEKAAVKEGEELLVKEGEKAGLKAGFKLTVGKVPLVSLLGLGFAVKRVFDGDWLGAGGEVASVVAAQVPGIGTGASVAIDALLVGRDLSQSQRQAVQPASVQPTLPPDALPANPFGVTGLGPVPGGNAFSSAPRGLSSNQEDPTTGIEAVADHGSAGAVSGTGALSAERHTASGAPVEYSPGLSRDGTGMSLLSRLQGAPSTPNLQAYLPASLRSADRSGVVTTELAGRDKKDVTQFMASLNVTPLSPQFRAALASDGRERKAVEVEQLDESAQAVGR